MSSFFTAPGALKKRKRAPTTDSGSKKRVTTSKFSQRPAKSQPTSRNRIERDDDSIASESGSDDVLGDAGASSASDSEDEATAETAAEKRLRLAENYLKQIREEVDTTGFDAKDIDDELLAERRAIAERLELDVSEAKGKVYKRIASALAYDQASHTLARCNTRTATSVAVCAPYVYTAHRDALVKWKLQPLAADQYPQTTKKKPKRTAPPRKRPIKVGMVKVDTRKAKDKSFQGHSGEILCVAASQDGKYVVTGGADRRIVVWDANTLKSLRVFTHHRDSVNGLVFRRGTNTLYSASSDRTVKVFQIPDAYVETLYGHADHVVDIDALAQERCVSVGARDRTCRLWKVVEESQLVFRGGSGLSSKKNKTGADPLSLAHEGSMDRIAQIDDQCFVTGSDNGSISLWSLQKKKPLFTVYLAHGLEPPLEPTSASAEVNPDPRHVVPPPQPRWITALETLPYSDLILSGSWDGYVRAWRFDEDKKTLEPAGVLANPRDLGGAVQTNGEPAAKASHSDDDDDDDDDDKMNGATSGPTPSTCKIKGIINDISVVERGERGNESLTVVCAVGGELRLGKWRKEKGAKNGTVVFEVAKAKTVIPNGEATADSNGGA
ncbi:WD40 repeat-like protein [Xylariaceae sp. FL0804]|nr:WD40 repeat-like protein [Xylariaceae sp. FL0804]